MLFYRVFVTLIDLVSFVSAVICFAFVYPINIYASSVRLYHHGGWILRPRCGIIGVKCRSRRYNDAMHCPFGTEVDNLAVANLRFCLLSCTDASWDNCIKCLFQGHNSDTPSMSIELPTLLLQFGVLSE